jgi:hypothetical protein
MTQADLNEDGKVLSLSRSLSLSLPFLSPPLPSPHPPHTHTRRSRLRWRTSSAEVLRCLLPPSHASHFLPSPTRPFPSPTNSGAIRRVCRSGFCSDFAEHTGASCAPRVCRIHTPHTTHHLPPATRDAVGARAGACLLGCRGGNGPRYVFVGV